MELLRTRPTGLVAALALALMVSACGSGSGAASAEPAHTSSTTDHDADHEAGHASAVATGFEDGTFGPFTEHPGARVTHAAARNGAFGLDVHAVGSEAYAGWDVGIRGGWWSFRAWMRVVSWTPGESVDLFTIRNLQAKNNFDLFVDQPVRTFRWDLYRGNTASATAPIALGQWHLVEARGSFATSTYVADVRIDGVPQTSITSTGQPPSAVRDIVLGPGATTKHNEVQYDDVRVEVATHPLELFGPPERAS
jgi:hypothetical protein